MFRRSLARFFSNGPVWEPSRECFLQNEGNGTILLKMNRSARKNAFGRTMLSEFRECLEVCQQEMAIRTVILKSEVGGVFSAGADLKERKEMSQEEARSFVSSLRSSFTALEDLRCPTIALIDGVALGGGLELALSCDMRVCSEKSKIGLPETSLAIIPGAGGTQRLPRLIGIPKAKELIFTADPVTGPVAQNIGLVNYCEADSEAALEKALFMASRISRNGPIALKAAKRAITDGVEVPRAQGMEVETDCYATILTTQDRIRGLEAFAQKKTPVYEGN
eukprot:TRINITY_DN14537_c0_g1_i1.p1 TRINITY_DN14537_c0_g1~~TRINITY_DN14537_c0_g1_i1.p1  ORF type:complete len:279 (+),score=46.28 TRINITY_DN14537_c0_g1_i1:112-948(+)